MAKRTRPKLADVRRRLTMAKSNSKQVFFSVSCHKKELRIMLKSATKLATTKNERNTFCRLAKKGHSTKGRGSNLQFGQTKK